MDMRYVHILGLSAVMSAVLIFAASRADAQQQHMVGGVPRNNFTGHTNNFSWERGHGFHHGFGGVWVVEREVEVPVYVEVPVAAAPSVTPPLPPHQGEGDKRKPYVIGASYDSLPGSCMKLIEEGVSFYYCSGEWYRQVGEGRGATYKAVKREL
jgi:hypothetical protein